MEECVQRWRGFILLDSARALVLQENVPEFPIVKERC